MMNANIFYLGVAGIRWTEEIQNREDRRIQAVAESAYLLQQTGPPRVQVLRGAEEQDHHCYRGE